MKKRMLANLTMLATLASTGLMAHEGHLHKVMGTVVAIDATHIEVATKDGKTESFVLTQETKYVRGKSAGLVSDVRIGERAVVSVIEKDGQKWGKEVRLAAAEGSGAR